MGRRRCRLTYCTAEESQRALAGEAVAFGMVGAAHVAVEAVAGGVGEELLLGVRRGDLLHLLERYAGILLPEMEHHRTGGALVAALVDVAAVVADGGSGIEQGGEIGRASCRERVCKYVEYSVVAVSLKKKNKTKEL